MKSKGSAAASFSGFNWIFGVSKKFWIALGVVLWLYFVISHIPAVWGAYLMTRGGDVGMSGVSGTVWSGRASLASVKINQADYSLGQLTWKLNGWSLLLLKPCADVETTMDNQQLQANICVGLGNVLIVSDANFSFPAALIQPQLPLPIDGKFSLHIDSLVMKNNVLADLEAKLSIADGRVYNGTNWMTIGGLGANMADDENAGINAHIFDVNSPIHVDVNAVFAAQAGTSIKGNLSMSEEFVQQSNANAWISMIATPTSPDAEGKMQYAVDINL